MTGAPATSPVLGPLAEPARRVGTRWIALIALANLGLYLGYYGPLEVLLPNQVQAIAGSAHKVAVLGWVTGIGAAVAMIANPVAWAWLTRFAVNLGNAMAILYLLYFLRDKVHYSRLFPGQKAEDGLLILILIYTAAVVLTAVTGGIISDRSGRRRLPVTIAGLVMAVPGITLAFWPTWPVAIASAVILGLGFGVYLSVDQALVTQVLPSAMGRAKDLGIINIANSGPQVLAPAIAAPLVSQLGGYPTLYLSVAAITVLGSAFVWKIRSVP